MALITMAIAMLLVSCKSEIRSNPPPVPIVRSITPVSATNTVVASFTVIGENLPLTTEMSIDGSICLVPTLRTSSGFTVRCRMGGAAGNKAVQITTNRIAYGGSVIDASISIEVTAPYKGYSASATGGCVYDNSTGLMWSVRTTDGGLLDWSNTYTHFNDTKSTQTKYAGWENGQIKFIRITQADIDAVTNVVGFVNRINSIGLCGHNDWRIASVLELESLVVTTADPAVDLQWFPNTRRAEIFRAASSFEGRADAYWASSGNSIFTYSLEPSGMYPVWLVRVGK